MRLAPLRVFSRCVHSSARQLSATSEEEERVVLVENRGPVRLIAINRTHCRNAVNPTTARVLYKAFRDFEAEASIHAAVLYGVGGTFCAGYDLKELSRAGQNWNMEDDIGKGPAPMVSTFLYFLTSPLMKSMHMN